MKLYELAINYHQLLQLEEDIDPEVFIETLGSIEDAIESKAENTAKLIRNLEAEAAAFKAEEERLNKHRKSVENKILGIKKYLQDQLQLVGMEKVKGDILTISLAKNPPSIKIINEDIIPAIYYVEQAPKLSKTTLLKDLKNGEEIPGVEMVQEMGLRIK